MSTAALTLYDHETELSQWIEAIDAAEQAAFPEEQLALIKERFSEQLTATREKRDRFSEFIGMLKSSEEWHTLEIARIQARRERMEKARKRLEQYAIETMQSLGVKKLEGNTSEMRLHGCPGSVEITDIKALPMEYLAATITVQADLWETHIERHNEMRALLGGVDDAGSCRLEQAAHVLMIPLKAKIADAIKSGKEVAGADLLIGKQRLVLS